MWNEPELTGPQRLARIHHNESRKDIPELPSMRELGIEESSSSSINQSYTTLRVPSGMGYGFTDIPSPAPSMSLSEPDTPWIKEQRRISSLQPPPAQSYQRSRTKESSFTKSPMISRNSASFSSNRSESMHTPKGESINSRASSSDANGFSKPSVTTNEQRDANLFPASRHFNMGLGGELKFGRFPSSGPSSSSVPITSSVTTPGGRVPSRISTGSRFVSGRRFSSFGNGNVLGSETKHVSFAASPSSNVSQSRLFQEQNPRRPFQDRNQSPNEVGSGSASETGKFQGPQVTANTQETPLISSMTPRNTSTPAFYHQQNDIKSSTEESSAPEDDSPSRRAASRMSSASSTSVNSLGQRSRLGNRRFSSSSSQRFNNTSTSSQGSGVGLGLQNIPDTPFSLSSHNGSTGLGFAATSTPFDGRSSQHEVRANGIASGIHGAGISSRLESEAAIPPISDTKERERSNSNVPSSTGNASSGASVGLRTGVTADTDLTDGDDGTSTSISLESDSNSSVMREVYTRVTQRLEELNMTTLKQRREIEQLLEQNHRLERANAEKDMALSASQRAEHEAKTQVRELQYQLEQMQQKKSSTINSYPNSNDAAATGLRAMERRLAEVQKALDSEIQSRHELEKVIHKEREDHSRTRRDLEREREYANDARSAALAAAAAAAETATPRAATYASPYMESAIPPTPGSVRAALHDTSSMSSNTTMGKSAAQIIDLELTAKRLSYQLDRATEDLAVQTSAYNTVRGELETTRAQLETFQAMNKVSPLERGALEDKITLLTQERDSANRELNLYTTLLKDNWDDLQHAISTSQMSSTLIDQINAMVRAI